MPFPRRRASVRRPEADPEPVVDVTTRPALRSPLAFEVITSPVYDLRNETRAGADVLVRNPPIRLTGAVDRSLDVAVSARFVLNEIRDRTDVVAANQAILAAAVGSLEAAPDSRPDDGSALGEPPAQESADRFVAIAVQVAFLSDDGFLDAVKSEVRAAGVDPRRLLLSVAPDEGLDDVWPSLQRLRSHGVRIALEHEGPTADCFDWLLRLPFDIVRLPASSALRPEVAVAGLSSEAGTGATGPHRVPEAPADRADPAVTPAFQRLVALGRALPWLEDVRTAAELDAFRRSGARLASGAAVDGLGV